MQGMRSYPQATSKHSWLTEWTNCCGGGYFFRNKTFLVITHVQTGKECEALMPNSVAIWFHLSEPRIFCSEGWGGRTRETWPQKTSDTRSGPLGHFPAAGLEPGVFSIISQKQPLTGWAQCLSVSPQTLQMHSHISFSIYLIVTNEPELLFHFWLKRSIILVRLLWWTGKTRTWKEQQIRKIFKNNWLILIGE